MNSKDQILRYIETYKKASADELWKNLGFSRQLVHKKLRGLVNEGLIVKFGTAPITFYQLAEPGSAIQRVEVPKKELKLINENYLYISPLGEMLYGFSGFERWVKSIKQDRYLVKLAKEYVSEKKKASKFVNKYGFIDATEKVRKTFDKIYLSKVFYLDFYSFPKFGKTRLGQLVLYSKQAQKYKLIKELARGVEPKVGEIIRRLQIDAVGFIPPTVPRQIQFLKEFEKILDIRLPRLEFKKSYIGELPVAQKTLSKLSDRVENASKTIFLRGNNDYGRVLLIDDAVGSGASLNETAKKLIQNKLAKKVYGLAIVGSYKGFDVIREI